MLCCNQTPFFCPTGDFHTYIGVMVIELHHNTGRRAGDTLRIPKDLDLIEDKRLVPGGIQGILFHHCLLALVKEGDDGVRI